MLLFMRYDVMKVYAMNASKLCQPALCLVDIGSIAVPRLHYHVEELSKSNVPFSNPKLSVVSNKDTAYSGLAS